MRDEMDCEIWLAHHDAYSAWVVGVAAAAWGGLRTRGTSKSPAHSGTGVQADDHGVEAASSSQAQQP